MIIIYADLGASLQGGYSLALQISNLYNQNKLLSILENMKGINSGVYLWHAIINVQT